LISNDLSGLAKRQKGGTSYKINIKMKRPDNPRLMEPLLPPDGTKVLEDLAVELVSATGASRIT